MIGSERFGLLGACKGLICVCSRLSEEGHGVRNVEERRRKDNTEEEYEGKGYMDQLIMFECHANNVNRENELVI